MIRFRGMFRELRAIFSTNFPPLLLSILFMATLGGCASTPSKDLAIVSSLPEMSSVEYIELSGNRRIALIYSRLGSEVPSVLIDSRGNPFTDVSKSYSEFAGRRALMSAGYKKVRLNCNDTRFVYSKIIKSAGNEPDQMRYVWERTGKLPVLVIYKLVDD